MPQTEFLQTLPGADLQAIKDGGRKIAFVVSKNKQVVADTVGYVLRNILRTDGVVHVLEPEQVQILIDLIDQQRGKIIELLQDKECLKVIVGSSKRERDARIELAGRVLDEVAARITEYQSREGK